MARITFKKEPRETGLAAVGRSEPNTTIKLDGKWCGMISAPSARALGGHEQWRVGLTVKHDGENIDWRWVYFKARFDTEPEAREWVLKNWDTLAELYTIIAHED